MCAVAGVVGRAEPFGTAWLDVVGRGLASAGAAWVVLRLMKSERTDRSRSVARLIAAIGAALLVAALNGLLAFATWVVVVVAIAVVGGRRVRLVLGGLSAISVVVAAAGSWALVQTADSLRDARNDTRRIEDELFVDPPAAQQRLADVEAELASAHSSVSSWWAQPARFFPVLSHHFRLADTVIDASTELISASAPLAGTTAEELVADGRIDLDRLGRLSGEVAVVADLAAAGERDLRSIDTRWLLGPARGQLDDAEVDFHDQADRLDRLARFSAGTLPYLGLDGPSRWFVLVCTPVEARASCGFPGNWVELEIDDGRADLVDSGRMAALEDQAEEAGLTLTGSSQFVTHYGRFDPVPTLRNITMTPDFPSSADVLADVLVDLGHPRPDVVAAVNTDGLEAILRITGPVDSGPMGQLNVQSVRRRLEIEQYTRFETQKDRREALDTAIRAIVDAVTDLDDVEIAKVRRLTETIDRGGLLAYVPGDDDNVFVEMGLAGGLPTGSLAGITVQNAGANKLDSYRSVTMTLTPATVDHEGCASIEIALGVAPDDSPDYVVENEVGLPSGWIRSWVSIYTPTPVVAAFLDGEQIAVEPRVEDGHPAVSLFIDTAPSGSNSITLRLDPGSAGPVSTLVQPSVEPYTVEIGTTCGS